MKTLFIMLMVVCALACGVADKAAKPTDQLKIQGLWLAQTESQNGNVRKVDYKYVFDGDKLSFTDETGKEVKYLFRLDTNASPRLMSIQPNDSLTKMAPVSVAYALEGDSLKIVVAPAGLRPISISDSNSQELIVCRRKEAIKQ
ncbi:MAG: TIGR03067 domain-containing protein [Bacteroidota bacterium]|nr:TIGR03067 domain-containing protein [Bacteroidota bacterium]